MAMLRVGAEQFRRELADILARVSYGGDQVIVERHGTPQVAVIPYALFEQLADLIHQRTAMPMTEEEFERLMIEKGVLLARDVVPTAAARDDWMPVPTQGKPLSEVIMEERR
jgi:prevent-host-death family protein